MTAVLFALSGTAAGVTQAGLLARAVQKGPSPLWLLARLLLVSAVLVLAAYGGHLLSSTAGFIVGFAIAATIAYRRLG